MRIAVEDPAWAIEGLAPDEATLCHQSERGSGFGQAPRPVCVAQCSAMIGLGDLTWPEVAGLAARTELMICLGSLEQHGPHLPLDTDSVIMSELARRWAQAAEGRLVTPVVPLGASGEHAGFPGTLSIGTNVTTDVIVEAVRSADAFQTVTLASWHGGNADAIAAARSILVREGRAPRVWAPCIAGDAHAGRTETSMMLAIDPVRVRLELAEPGNTTPLEALMPRLRGEGVASVAPNGVLGDPTGASAEEGHRLLDAVASEGFE